MQLIFNRENFPQHSFRRALVHDAMQLWIKTGVVLEPQTLADIEGSLFTSHWKFFKIVFTLCIAIYWTATILILKELKIEA